MIEVRTDQLIQIPSLMALTARVAEVAATATSTMKVNRHQTTNEGDTALHSTLTLYQ